MRSIGYQKGRLEASSDHPRPERKAGEALIRTKLAGICATDLEIVKGYMEYEGILGHEFAGVVEECDDPGWIGKRVVGEINCACGDCEFCRRGLRTHCPNRSVLGIYNRDGVFAEFFSLPVANLHPIPDSLPDEEAVFIEPLAAAYQILEQIKIVSKDRVAVFGDGKLGLLVVQVLAEITERPILIGRHPERTAIFLGKAIDFARFEDCPSGSFDLVIECTGSSQGLSLAIGLLRPRGTLVVKSTVFERVSMDFSQVVVNEITLVGSRCGPFPKALAGLTAKKIRVSPLVEEMVPLQDGLRAFEKAGQAGTLKVLLTH
ncbi:MAG: alcohol dehydrogenase catalytic domain-containing protein [Candidatus Binatia bacterium]|nr:alcohol dehydrogenase catalytic domain-containing protein [Candidatus Binatia bacterium]